MKLFFIFIINFLFLSSIVYSFESEDQDFTKTKKELAPEVIELINFSWNKTIKPIFKRACFDCHSNQTIFPWYHKIPIVQQFLNYHISQGRESLDFSNGFPFTGSLRKKGYIKMLKKINKEVKEGEMPTFPYTLMHPKSKLSRKDLLFISNWVMKSIKVLKN